MSEDDVLKGRLPRRDIEEAFPPRLVDTLGPGVLTTPAQVNAALVAAELLALVARRGGSRIRPAEVDEALANLDRAVTGDVRAHCRDEARRIAAWIEDPPRGEAPVEGPLDDLGLMHAADIRSRVSVAKWAMAAGLELELEWYEPETDIWPRERGTPTDIFDPDEDTAVLAIETATGEYEIPVVNIRWLMPVERRDRPTPHRARVLTFPGAPAAPEED